MSEPTSIVMLRGESIGELRAMLSMLTSSVVQGSVPSFQRPSLPNR
jgi:hypothetical protein